VIDDHLTLAELLDNLNEPQREAVTDPSRAVLVFAGAGSGKTRVLTYRIAYLILSGAAAPENILAVTFTNKAAGEMKDRIHTMLGSRGRRVWVSTFHAACLRILRGHIHHLERRCDFVIYDEDDQQRLMLALMKEAGVGTHAYSPRSMLKEIERAKNQAVGPDHYRPDEFNPYQRKAALLYPLYEHALRIRNAVDFNDLLYLTHLLLQRHPDVQASFHRRLGHLLVDEYQDTNVIQHLLIQDLLGSEASLCVVGDDDQSIYRWRGAEPANILGFERDFPDARIIKLEQNYRSTQRILQGAHSVVCRNHCRKEKRLWTGNQHGELISFYHATDEEDEAHWVARRIATEANGTYNEYAVFYRINAQSRALEEAFMQWGIPYALVGSVRFYQRKEIKDLIAYLRILVNPNDDVSLKRIINAPPRGIGAKTMERLETFARNSGTTLYAALKGLANEDTVSTQARKRVAMVATLLEELRGQAAHRPLPDLLNQIIERTGYIDYLAERGEEGRSRVENVRELLVAIKKSGAMALDEFLDQVALVSDTDDYDNASNRVTLMTLHSAKGLQFPVVFIVGLEEGLLPYYLRLDNPEDLEEERRLCYVGMTRAEQKLCMTCAGRRSLFGAQQRRMPSRFVREIPRDIVSPEGRPGAAYPSSWVWEGGVMSGETYYEFD
jgi:DNA helicase-2/ATP-dependent DNA helicase PcrA